MSRIHCEVELERPGKQQGYLRLPCPQNHSAWGVQLIPITVIAQGSGPTVLLTAGLHGDEYEGPVILSKLSRSLQAEQIQGRVILLPALNLAGLDASQRLSPLDGRDLNRSFPGDAEGSPAQALADYITHELLPPAELVLDFHSGGYSLDFLPSIIMHRLPDAQREARTLEGLQAFGGPYGLILEELDATGMFDSLVEKLGKVFLTTELSGGGRLSPTALSIAHDGVLRLLHWFGVLRDASILPGPSEPQILLEVPDSACYTHTPEAGVYEPFYTLGETVQAGATLGQIHFLARPQREPLLLRAQIEGLLWACRPPARVAAGDCVAVLAQTV